MAYVRGNDYFKKFVELMDFSVEAAKELASLLKEFRYNDLGSQLVALHRIEHKADEKKHVVMEELAKEFITPIEREDIIQIIRLIDDITDAVEDVLIKIYMYHIETIRREALAFSEIVVQCCEALRLVFQEFHNFKKSKVLHEAIIKVNHLEEEGDKLYMSAVRSLYSSGVDPIECLAWTEVFSQLERCCDLCEDTADNVEEIVMKNA